MITVTPPATAGTPGAPGSDAPPPATPTTPATPGATDGDADGDASPPATPTTDGDDDAPTMETGMAEGAHRSVPVDPRHILCVVTVEGGLRRGVTPARGQAAIAVCVP